MKSLKHLTMVALLLTLLTSSVLSAVPQLIPYQGRLTDLADNPVVDGGHLVKFIIYDADAAGAELWNSGFQAVITKDGLFSYDLGSVVPLPNNLFNDTSRYLGITIGADPEIAPRTRFETSAYAYHALQADNANLLDGKNSTDFVETAGDVMTGSLGFSNGSYPMNYVYQSGTVNPSRAIAAHSPSFPEYGIFYSDPQDKIVFYGFGDTSLIVDLDSPGDNAVQMPDNAVNADEILNEPGVASQESNSGLTLTTIMQDVESVEITIPAPGYIMVTGRCYMYTSGSTLENHLFTQIDETEGGDRVWPYVTKCGMDEFPSTGEHYYNAVATRTYFKATAGTYTFRLEAKQRSATHTSRVYSALVSAMYVPTSYGPTVASSEFATEGSIPVQVMAEEDPAVTKTMYQVNLRALELRAKEARIKALEAERDLQNAQQENR